MEFDFQNHFQILTSITYDLQRHLPALFGTALLLIFIRTVLWQRTHPLPPGPRGVPFFGNAFQLSMTPWKEFEAWKKIYGDLMFITVAGQGMLILNTYETASDLLDGRGANYGDRPRCIVASEILTGGLSVAFAPYGKFWRRMRRAGHEATNKAKSSDYYHTHVREALLMTDGMLRNPSNWEREIHRMAVSTILSILYDHPEVKSMKEPLVARLEEFGETLIKAASPGTYLVEFFPWMKRIPSWLAKWKRDAERQHRDYSDMFVGLVDNVEGRINAGDERPSFIGTIIRERQRLQVTNSEAAWLSATMFIAGSESTATSLVWFMLAMIAFPEIQKRCHMELDAVVGRSRMPTFKDRDNLPYIQAAAQEALRWRPIGPLGFQHCTKEDDWYKGYFIPKGTVCLANIWSINRSKDIYGQDADDFNPGRFLDEKASPVLKDIKDGHVTFGFGPRSCLGRHVATNELFMNIATILWAANILPSKDANGKPLIPDSLVTVNLGVVSRPLPFEFSMTPRFPEVTAIIAQTKELI